VPPPTTSAASPKAISRTRRLGQTQCTLAAIRPWQQALPAGRRATHLRIVAKIRPEKVENKRTRFTVGYNLIQYTGDVSTPTADITTAKCLFTSVLSTPDEPFTTIEIKDFLKNPMKQYEYMRIPVKSFPTVSFSNTSSHASSTMATSSLKSAKACTVSPNQQAR
jgi:hypothetical protein